MFDIFSIKRVSTNSWEVHIENGNKAKTTTVSTSECVIYVDKVNELLESLDNKNYRAIQRDLE